MGTVKYFENINFILNKSNRDYLRGNKNVRYAIL